MVGLFFVDLSIAKDGSSASFKPLIEGQLELLISSAAEAAPTNLMAVSFYETPLIMECLNINENQWQRAEEPFVEVDVNPAP